MWGTNVDGYWCGEIHLQYPTAFEGRLQTINDTGFWTNMETGTDFDWPVDEKRGWSGWEQWGESATICQGKYLSYPLPPLHSPYFHLHVTDNSNSSRHVTGHAYWLGSNAEDGRTPMMSQYHQESYLC